jgi:parallel beta-helix repeat protein
MRALDRLHTASRTRLVVSLVILASLAASLAGCIPGRFIPESNHPVPRGAIFLATDGKDSNNGSESSPVGTLNRAMDLVPADGTIVVRGGVYRDWYHSGTTYKIGTKGITIQNYPHEHVWFDGTDVIPPGQWTSNGAGIWHKAWSTPSFCDGQYYRYPPTNQPTSNIGPCAHFDNDSSAPAPVAGDPQMVFVDDTPLVQKPTLATIDSGSFYYDWTNRRIYIATDPNGKTVELAARPVALVLGGSNLKGNTVRGIGFRRFATNEYNNVTGAALYLGGAGPNRVEHTVFTENAAGGLFYSNPREGSYLKGSVFARNGGTALGANGGAKPTGSTTNNFLVEGNWFNGNNTEQFGTGCTKSCAAANVKMAHMNGLMFRFNVVEHAKGPAEGVWHDLRGRNCAFVNNIVRYNGVGSNKGKGIYYEVSDGGRIVGNLVYGNGGPGIAVASGNTKVWNNTLVDNQFGVWVYDDPRYPGQDTNVEVNTTNVEVVNNVVSNAPTYMAKSQQAWSNVTQNNQPQDFYSSYDYNAYHRSNGPNQILHMWEEQGGGIAYRSLGTFAQAWGWDSHSVDLAGGPDPFFVDKAGGDFRIRSDSPAFNSGKPLPADIAALLRLPAGSIPSRGFIPPQL